MHYLIVFPYYFFTALTLALGLAIVVRLLRLPLPINTVVTAAVVASLIGYLVALASEAISIDDFTALPMIGIGLLSFVLAAIESVLRRALPHAMDDELQAEH